MNREVLKRGKSFAVLFCVLSVLWTAHATNHDLGTFAGSKTISGKMTSSEKIGTAGIYIGGTGTYVHPNWISLSSTTYAHIYSFVAAESGTVTVSSFTTSHATGNGSVSLYVYATSTTEFYNAGTGKIPVTRGASYYVRVYSGSALGQTFSFKLTAPGSNVKPDLAPKAKDDWSSPLVVSTSSTSVSSTASSFKTTDRLYVSWSVGCTGKAVGTAFVSTLYIDGVSKKTWNSPDGASLNGYVYVTGYDIGTLSSGTHTIKITTDSGGAVSESNESNNTYSRTITITGSAKPDLVPKAQNGWSSPLVVSTSSTSVSSTASSFEATDRLYVSWSVGCTGKAVDTTFISTLYIDGVSKKTWNSPGGASLNGYVYVKGYDIGTLSSGTHTIKIATDSGGDVSESNESNNTYSRTITIAKPKANPGRIVVRSVGPVTAGDTFRMVISRVGGSEGSIAVKAKTQTSTALMGVDGSADFDYVKEILEWGDGDTSDRYIDIPTYIQPWEGTKMLRVKLATLATGLYSGNLVPKLDMAKIYVDLENPSQFGTVSVEPEEGTPVAGEPLRLVFRREEGCDWPIAVKYKVQTSTAIAGQDFEYMKDVIYWDDGEDDERVIEVPTYPSAAGKQLRVKLSTLTQGEYTGCVTPHVRNAKVYVPLR